MEGFVEPINFRDQELWNSTPVPERVAQRSIDNSDVDENGCWVSRYSVTTTGYAQIGWSLPEVERNGKSRNRMVLAHRAAWVSIHGQVPVGMTIDHTCKNRRCVNPDHLRLLSNAENARRNQGDDFPSGFCRRGHPDSMRVEVTRRTKAGEPRTGLTCGPCLKLARDKWAATNAEKIRVAHRKYNEKRRAA
jgi:hypothetical protein